MMENTAASQKAAVRLSKKSSFCWAFSIFYDIIHMGDENA